MDLNLFQPEHFNFNVELDVATQNTIVILHVVLPDGTFYNLKRILQPSLYTFEEMEENIKRDMMRELLSKLKELGNEPDNEAKPYRKTVRAKAVSA